MLLAVALRIASSTAARMSAAASAASTPWPNSTADGVHTFLTFDSAMEHQKANITAFASRIDYVWGASAANVATWRASPNPAVVLSKYIPFTRDPAPHVTPVPNTSGSGLPWWQTHKPELVLYRCDRKTPAWECFAGEGCAHVSVRIRKKPHWSQMPMTLGKSCTSLPMTN